MNIEHLFSSLPDNLRNELIDAFRQIVVNYREGRWEPSELNGGKLCEIVYSLIFGYMDGNLPDHSTKPRNMVLACQSLEQKPNTFPRSIRIQIPRMLIALYEVRNNRGVGHVGSDINPNIMDATCVLYMSKWIIAELIRIFHNVNIEEAEEAVNLVIERQIPVIWKIGDKMRVLDTKITLREKTLLLLYQNSTHLTEENLISWLEQTNPTNFRNRVLINLHIEKLIEYDKKSKIIYISPLGINFVEKNLLSKLNIVHF